MRLRVTVQAIGGRVDLTTTAPKAGYDVTDDIVEVLRQMELACRL
jgi:hypothetical protein